MTANERFIKVAQATERQLELIDAILLGETASCREAKNVKLLTITEACERLGVNYTRMYRILKDGMLDVVDATGKRMIREESLIEYADGKRKPSAEALARRADMNAKRRSEYAGKKVAA